MYKTLQCWLIDTDCLNINSLLMQLCRAGHCGPMKSSIDIFKHFIICVERKSSPIGPSNCHVCFAELFCKEPLMLTSVGRGYGNGVFVDMCLCVCKFVCTSTT